jgi:exopolyphosphatase/guanosine-5'-triphosphate,3'-diphosphate pyrophosphatase
MSRPVPPSITGAVRRAVIDIGTNSVKLLVADVAGPRVETVLERSEQTRLGAGFYTDHRLRPENIAATARAVAAFAALAQGQGSGAPRVIATSAVREAVNREELLAAIGAAAGLPVEVISGEQEARWVYQGATLGLEVGDQPLLVMDLGGGSTEFILGHDGHQAARCSVKLGTVRWLERMPPGDPPAADELGRCRESLRAFLSSEVGPILAPVWSQMGQRPQWLIATGGTSTILVRMEKRLQVHDWRQIEGERLTLAQVRARVQELWTMPLVRRRELPGLPANRADVILFGSAICETVLEEFGIAGLQASTRGLRHAAVLAG